MRLPDSFTNRMNEYFQRECIPSEGFFESFDNEPLKGIRINRDKVAPEEYEAVLKDLGEETDKVSWCDSGFYTKNESSGNDPYYHAGVYYPQEPSAMLPAQIAAAKPGEYVLDMCAAPGGKACRLGEDLKGEGLLIANEINENRAKALLRNIERMGIINTVILNETPAGLSKVFKGFFDKIVLDVPCSGEGMFRRDPNAVKSWEKFGPDTCIPMQEDILINADKMLKAGGEIVYSTCTFFEGEDEERIHAFIKDHPYYSIIPHPEVEGISHSKEGFMRIWPHLSKGDGHFCVHLKKSEDAVTEEIELSRIPSYKNKRGDNYGFGKSRDAYESFLKEILTDTSDYRGDFILHKDKVHILPVPERLFNGLKTVKLGLFPGEIKCTSTDRLFVPSHSLALTLDRNKIRKDSFLKLNREDPRLTRYLKGETITVTEEEKQSLRKKGYIVIGASEYPLGFGKISGDGSVKNLYPKAWRLV